MNESRSDGNIFNAYATVVGQLKKKRYIKGLEDEEDMSRPAILLHDGMCMAYTVIAAAYMAYSTEMVLSEPEKLREVLLEMNRLLCDKDGRFGKTQLGEMVRKFKLFPEEARKLERIKTLASSMIAFVIAHEFGHIIHGDIFNGVDSGVYSRNMERAADQFAADAIKSLEDPDICKFMFLGAALSFIADAALGNADITIAVEDSDSHPATLERFNNLLKNAPCSIEHFNMTESVFRKCMP
jgi:hypothetical protein